MSDFPDISLVMSAFNRAELLDLSLASIVRNMPPFPFEIVVVNDGLYNDDTLPVCYKYSESLRIRYYFTGHRNMDGIIKRNPAIPNNVAIRKAEGDILILTCPEMMHLNGAIELTVNPLLKDMNLLSVPESVYFDNTNRFTQEAKTGVMNTGLLTDRSDHAKMPFFMGIWKHRLNRIRGYDEDFTGYALEDNDFADRMIADGCKYHRTEAKVVHLYHDNHCSGYAYTNDPRWQYNKKLYDDRRNKIIRNQGRKWGKISYWL